MRVFGLGKILAIPSGGLNPVEVGLLQGVTVDFSWDVKELYGQLQFPVEVARGKGKVSLSADFAEIRAGAFNQVLDGAITDGITGMSPDEANTIVEGAATVASTAITVTPPDSGTFSANMLVVDVSSTSAPPIVMTQVASDTSVTVTGQYYVSAGVYLFSTADAGHDVKISYTYTASVGKSLAVTNKLMGVAPRFAVRTYNVYGDYQFGLYFPSVISSKLTADFKIDDFCIPSIDFQVMADGAGNVATAYFGLE